MAVTVRVDLSALTVADLDEVNRQLADGAPPSEVAARVSELTRYRLAQSLAATLDPTAAPIPAFVRT